jgi:hypothetical protein
MRMGNWFCSLGQVTREKTTAFTALVLGHQKKTAPVDTGGAEQVCSQLCGKQRCECGANFKGPHCLWNHYRL